MKSKTVIGMGLIAILLLLIGGSYYYHKNYQNKYGYQYHSIQDTKRMARRLSQIDRAIDDLETEQNQIETQRQFNPDDRDLSLNQTSWQKAADILAKSKTYERQLKQLQATPQQTKAPRARLAKLIQWVKMVQAE